MNYTTALISFNKKKDLFYFRAFQFEEEKGWKKGAREWRGLKGPGTKKGTSRESSDN